MTTNISADATVLSDFLETSLEGLNKEVINKKSEIEDLQKQIDLIKAKLEKESAPYKDMWQKEKCLKYFISLLKSSNKYYDDYATAMKIVKRNAYDLVHRELLDMHQSGLLKEEYSARGQIKYVWREGIQEFLISQYEAALAKTKSVSGEQQTLF